MRVYFIGLNHRHQLCGYKQGAAEKFDSYLHKFCHDANIDLISEELSEAAISLWGATGSVARNVALQLSIQHLFCDPSPDERECLGILTSKEIAVSLGFEEVWSKTQEAEITAEERNYWPIRERFWLERLRTVAFHNCAFILGSEHVDSFGSLLGTEGYQVQVICRDWETNS
jgi:hypothetical protein